MVSHQSFSQWQQSPIQGAIPSVPSDSEHLEVIQDNLLDAISNLQFCHTYLEGSGISKRYSQLFTAVADALNSTNQAIEHCDDSPDTAPITIDYQGQLQTNEQKGISLGVAQHKTVTDRTAATHKTADMDEKLKQAEIAAELARATTQDKQNKLDEFRKSLGEYAA